MHSTYRGWRNVHMMRPSDILFTQWSISNTFGRRDQHRGRLIGHTLDDLREGRITVWDICPIRVFQHNGRWWSMDNRRLWVFRQFQKAGGCNEIPVQIKTKEEMDGRKFSTRTGEDVHVKRELDFFICTGSEWYDEQERQREREAWKRLASLGDKTRKEHRATPERDTGVTPLIEKNVGPKHAKDEASEQQPKHAQGKASEQKAKTDAVRPLCCGFFSWIAYSMFTANK